MASSSQTVNVYRRPGRSLKILQNSDAKNRKTAAQLRPRRLHDGNNLKTNIFGVKRQMIAKLVYPRWILWFIVAILDIMPR